METLDINICRWKNEKKTQMCWLGNITSVLPRYYQVHHGGNTMVIPWISILYYHDKSWYYHGKTIWKFEKKSCCPGNTAPVKIITVVKPHGITMVIPWISYGNTTVLFCWTKRSINTGYYRGNPMVLPWCYRGKTKCRLVLPWYYRENHGNTMITESVIPW